MMKDIYELVIKLIGKQEGDPAFSKLIEVTEIEPFKYGDSRYDVWFYFEDCGLHVALLKDPSCFGVARLLRGSAKTKGYEGNFPNGVCWNDLPAVVAAKLGQAPHSSTFRETPTETSADEQALVEEYVSPAIHYEFKFDSAGLHSLTIFHWSAYTIPGYAAENELSTADVVTANRAKWSATRQSYQNHR